MNKPIRTQDFYSLAQLEGLLASDGLTVEDARQLLQDTPNPDCLSNAEADCLCFAVRYALNRPETTAPLTVALEVVRVWHRLQGWHRKQLQKEVLETANRPKIWQRVLDMDLDLPY
ncbi:hypothetical protein [Hymenobacter sp. BT491]|uniref:hypothetical protein n=1 Tax=Hymenobacter sp. BT491 TaxID=2766779 RepID=UPI0016539BF6|nr:hypothetical protein [Hymenobacter sp. BT491]MBC6988964.1 hypothetical protein [Hymenobacter sp. BT491]